MRFSDLPPNGTKNTFSSASEADEAWDLAVDRSGNVFVRNRHDAVLKFDQSGTPIIFSRDLSPDKQWECKAGEIVKAGATQVVLDLNQELEVYGPETEIVWAPDSKRFGFNYSLYMRTTRLMKRSRFTSCVVTNGWPCIHRPTRQSPFSCCNPH